MPQIYGRYNFRKRPLKQTIPYPFSLSARTSPKPKRRSPQKRRATSVGLYGFGILAGAAPAGPVAMPATAPFFLNLDVKVNVDDKNGHEDEDDLNEPLPRYEDVVAPMMPQQAEVVKAEGGSVQGGVADHNPGPGASTVKPLAPEDLTVRNRNNVSLFFALMLRVSYVL